ncbi:MAG: stage II sporulation protein R [Clostridia bacterium]|nr:stage II sporulation protein R [Clostridia bacterium]
MAAAHTGGYVRFHVIADDDTAEAQALKIKVRDAVSDRVKSLFAECVNPEEAWRIARENEKVMEKWAREAALANGYAGSIVVRAEECEFEEREYGDITLPAGKYRAIRVIIGEGKGQNWWCLLYPDVCMPEGYEPGMKVEFYSSIFRWIRSIFGGNENG